MISIAYKLADAAEWARAQELGAYVGSAVDLADGYIHMSTADRLAETARRHYRGRGDLVVAAINLETLRAGLVWEPSRGGALFPHLYGPLPMSAVVSARPASVDAGGGLKFDDGAPPWP